MKTQNFNFLKKSAFVVAMIGSVLFSSCRTDREQMVPVAPKTISNIVAGDSNFSLLKVALVQAGLVDVLNGAGPFTVFAPDNAAFAAAGLETEAKIKNVPVQTLKNILLYHVLGQKVASSTIATASNTPVKSASDVNLFITKNAGGVFVNGAKVTQADIMATNGVIHVVNTVLMPPTGNIVETAQGNPNFTFLVAAVVKASTGSTNVAQVLSGVGPLTVFAPTNQAFINAGFPNIAAVQAADAATLTTILTYHVLSARVFSSDLTEGLKPTTLNGGMVTISLNGGAKVKGNGNATPSVITQANLVTTNGVIHVVDQVLKP